MIKRHIFPRGFEVTAPSEVSTTKRVEGDAEVEYLYRVFINHEAGYNSWEFRNETLKVAKRLMGLSLTGWASRHTDSIFLNQSARSFIRDTIHFIETGRRTMHTRNWLDLLDTNPNAMPVTIKDNATDLSETLVRNTNTYLSLWLSHPGGFEDLLTCLVIMYGPGLPSTRQRIGVDHISPKNPKLQALTAAITRNVQPPEEDVFNP